MEKIIAVYCEDVRDVVGFIETDYSVKETMNKLDHVFKALSSILEENLRWHYIAVTITAMDDPKIRVKSVDCSIEIDEEGNYTF